MFKKYFIRGLIFGIFNEVMFAPMWDYSKLLWLFIPGTDIPILFIFGWGLIISLILYITDRLSRKLFFISKTTIDVTLMILICLPLELFCSRVLKLWTYNYSLHANFFGALLGYFLAGIIISLFCRYKES